LFEGREVTAMDKKNLQQYRGGDISMIFQDPMTSLNPTMTCGNQIMESLLLHTTQIKSEARRMAVDTLKMVQIPDPEKRMGQYPHQLSGGMRQRVMIAIALSCRPSVLIADEPTTALDVTIQAQVIDLLRELKVSTGTAVILVTHDLGVVANFADRILVMYAGRIVERGTARDIFYNSRHPYTKALISAMPTADPDFENTRTRLKLKGEIPSPITPPSGCKFRTRCQFATDSCAEAVPKLLEVKPGHFAACVK
jgi:oligopeptide transport system ATP-binding protein